MLAAALCLGLTSLTLPAVAGTPAIADLQVHLGDHGPRWGLFGDDIDADTGENPIWAADPGTWTAEPAQAGDRLRLRIALTPPEVNPVLGDGAATLVTGVGIEYGLESSGDIGHQRRLGFTWTPLEPCAGSPCTFTADVSIALRRAQRFIASMTGIESPVVVIGFTLVRTFGAGEWLQVSATQDGGTIRRSTALARLGAREGSIPRAPVVPSGEAHIAGLREAPNPGIDELMRWLRSADQGSEPIPTVTARVDVRASDCESGVGVQLVDAWGTLPLAGSIATIGPAGTLAAIPDGTSWSLLVRGSSMGDFEAAGGDRIVTATITCAMAADGTETTLGRVTAEPPTGQLPAAPDPIAWLVAVESFRRDRPLNLTLPAAMPGGFIAIERTQGGGWITDRSLDGLTWQRIARARLPMAIRGDAVRGCGSRLRVIAWCSRGSSRTAWAVTASGCGPAGTGASGLRAR